ncbi:serine-repeat antigen [Chlorella sorokiniana]|uniref:Serine-repeat antigen n=1 Tax=Chlorella sorokiniana TaxID=3076 RepID=A0A2P6TQV0_CHLSO|nr:serine-repeat antigen [Chlorella sorokiniana]|eukprot:PRW56438.1 serine-repeat antigen [Chlorella sorokiniana]
MPQRAQPTALSTSASGSSAPAAASTDGGWSADAQPGSAVYTDESSGQGCEAQSREPAEQQPQQPQPLLMQWLASVDPATRRHAAGVVAAVNVATAISVMCSHPALTGLGWSGDLLHTAAAPAPPAAPCDGSSVHAPAAAEALPTQPASPPLELAVERKKRPSGTADVACQ